MLIALVKPSGPSALCLWLDHQFLNRLDIDSGSIQVAVLLVSTPAIFVATITRIQKDF